MNEELKTDLAHWEKKFKEKAGNKFDRGGFYALAAIHDCFNEGTLPPEWAMQHFNKAIVAWFMGGIRPLENALGIGSKYPPSINACKTLKSHNEQIRIYVIVSDCKREGGTLEEGYNLATEKVNKDRLAAGNSPLDRETVKRYFLRTRKALREGFDGGHELK